MKTHVITALRLTALLLILLSGLYTLLVWGAAQFAPGGGKGRMIQAGGRQYFEQVGQSFRSPAYFNSRPSAVNYNAAGSGGSNKAPFDTAYLSLMQARIDTFLKYNPGQSLHEVPAELLSASGSGLDPHISVQAARVQVKRISRYRNIPETRLQQLVAEHTEGPFLGIAGPEKVHVLHLNLALDALTAKK